MYITIISQNWRLVFQINIIVCIILTLSYMIKMKLSFFEIHYMATGQRLSICLLVWSSRGTLSCHDARGWGKNPNVCTNQFTIVLTTGIGRITSGSRRSGRSCHEQMLVMLWKMLAPRTGQLITWQGSCCLLSHNGHDMLVWTEKIVVRGASNLGCSPPCQ